MVGSHPRQEGRQQQQGKRKRSGIVVGTPLARRREARGTAPVSCYPAGTTMPSGWAGSVTPPSLAKGENDHPGARRGAGAGSGSGLGV